MATKKEIRNYAEANNISREEARQHFINEAIKRKEAKQNPTVSLTADQTKMLGQVCSAAEEIVAEYSEANYDASSCIRLEVVARAVALIHGKGATQYQDALCIREVVEKTIDAQCGTRVGPNASGNKAHIDDVETHMKNKGVPRVQRVALGILDILVSEVNPNFHRINVLG